MKDKSEDKIPPVPHNRYAIVGSHAVFLKQAALSKPSDCIVRIALLPLLHLCHRSRAQSLLDHSAIVAKPWLSIYRSWCPLSGAYSRDPRTCILPGAQSYWWASEGPVGNRSSPGGSAWQQRSNAEPFGARQAATRTYARPAPLTYRAPLPGSGTETNSSL